MRIATLCAAALLTAGAHAEIFKCKGADGKTLYQSTPCAATGAKDLGTVDIRNDRSSTDTLESAYSKQENLRDADQAISERLAREHEQLVAKREREEREAREKREEQQRQCDKYRRLMIGLVGPDWQKATPEKWAEGYYYEYKDGIAQYCK